MEVQKPTTEDKKLSAEERRRLREDRRLQRIEQLTARLQQEKARQSTAERKRRTGWLISWGVLVETIFKSADAVGRQKLIDSAKKNLTDRNLQRALDGFAHLGGDVGKQKPQEQEQDSSPLA